MPFIKESADNFSGNATSIHFRRWKVCIRKWLPTLFSVDEEDDESTPSTQTRSVGLPVVS